MAKGVQWLGVAVSMVVLLVGTAPLGAEVYYKGEWVKIPGF
jgi:hypothetical protein